MDDNINKKLTNLFKWEDNELIDIKLNSKNKLKKLKKFNEENKISFKDYLEYSQNIFPMI